jgi:hypothetical protein
MECLLQEFMTRQFRIAHIYDSQCGRNDGAPLYTLEALKRVEGVAVDHYLPIGDPTLWGNYDLYWWVDFADDALGYGEFPCPKPNFYWCSDYHISKESYDYRLRRAGQFDWIGCYQKDNVERFIADGVPEDRIFWLPPAFEPGCYRPGVFDFKTFKWVDAAPMKRYDISFVGHVNNQKRMDALDTLFKAIPNFFYGTKRFEKAAMIYNQSKVVFNIAHDKDTNMRIPECLGTKSLLLTERVPHLDEIFQDGVHLVMYDGIEDAIEKAKYFIEHDSERETIAEAGYKQALKSHTYTDRVQTVLDMVRMGAVSV